MQPLTWLSKSVRAASPR